MNHVKWAFGILIVIVAVSVFSEFTVSRERIELTDMLYELKEAADNGDTERAEALCLTVKDKWNKAEMIFSYTVPVDKICQAEQSICKLEPLLAADADEFEAEVMTAVVLCSRIG